MYILYHTFTNNANVIFLWYMFWWVGTREANVKIFYGWKNGKENILSFASKLRAIVVPHIKFLCSSPLISAFGFIHLSPPLFVRLFVKLFFP